MRTKAPEEQQPVCVECGSPFGSEELAAVRVASTGKESCLVKCENCGTENELVSVPREGLGEPPAPKVSGRSDKSRHRG